MGLGDTRFLDSYNGNPSQAFMGDACCSGSLWRVTPTEDGSHLLTNSSFPTQLLEPEPDTNLLYLRPVAGAPTAAQKWIITAIGGGFYTLTNVGLGAGFVVSIDGDPPNDPTMGIPIGAATEAWKFTKR
jgi:hypothetical protein